MTSTEISIVDHTLDDSSTPILLANINANATNGSALFSPSENDDFVWEFNVNMIIISALASMFIIVLVGTGIWYWCTQVHRARRRHSLPIAVDSFIEARNIREKRLSSSPIMNVSNKAPPVPPRPMAYTTTLGKVEYRSNL